MTGLNWTAALWFAAIVASIPVLLWLFKRSQMLGANASSGTARAVAVLPLSASQKVVTVEVGRGDERLWLVLGVTPQAITTLHTMSALPPLPPTVPGAMDDPVPPHGPASATFAQLLGRLRGGGHSDAGRHDR
ncbi:MAG: flagellar biosynthetic protein FliO [Betaproteobacteria bacterium]|nr:flagellar biosynthetic protein FliO [Betaproteobacteria bacterium]MCC6249485.1 flagellar biosynthetic protein FliO [Rubrivivax sp.]MCL4697290.1 flagellar biosynthetic protein FliO [Burkholderiaceae bacterium]